MDLQLLETFLDLAETRNFTMTAKRLKKSQAAISLQINRLEEMLGKFLFDRDNRNVNLSQDGEILVGYAKQILNMHQELLYRFSSLPIEGTVSIGTTDEIANLYLAEILSLFSKQYPKIVLNVSCDLKDNLVQQFQNEAVDMILIHQEPKTTHSDAIVVQEEAFIWVKAKDIAIDPSKPLPIILNPEPCSIRQKTLESLSKAQVKSRIVYTSTSYAGKIAAVKAGLGIALIPASQSKKEFEILDLPYLPKFPNQQMVIMKSKKITLAQEALADHIYTQIKD
jgi:DNA-binding transcriptional LysR family regulator